MATNNTNAASAADASVSHRATQRARDAVDDLGARGAEAEERLREASEQVSARTQELAQEVAGFVSRKPLASLGIAAAIGFILASLLRR